MSLVFCPECGKEGISSTATACPSCGYNIKQFYENLAVEKEQKRLEEEQKKRKAEMIEKQTARHNQLLASVKFPAPWGPKKYWVISSCTGGIYCTLCLLLSLLSSITSKDFSNMTLFLPIYISFIIMDLIVAFFCHMRYKGIMKHPDLYRQIKVEQMEKHENNQPKAVLVGDKLVCPYCGSTNIDIQTYQENGDSVTTSVSKGKARSVIVPIVPAAKGKGKTVSTSHQNYKYVTIRTCMNCGNQI